MDSVQTTPVEVAEFKRELKAAIIKRGITLGVDLEAEDGSFQPFDNDNVDSLDIVEIAMDLEEAFDIAFNMKTLTSKLSIHEMYDIYVSRLGKADGAP